METGANAVERCPRCSAALDLMTTRQISDLPTGSPHQRVDHFCALLDNIRSIHNVGSMFRTADGAGLGHLYLCGITATPEQPKLAKAALGAHETVPWSYTPNAVDLAQSLKASGRRLWALERLDSDSPITLPSVIPTDATAGSIVLIVGNEKAGVDPALAVAVRADHSPANDGSQGIAQCGRGLWHRCLCPAFRSRAAA